MAVYVDKAKNKYRRGMLMSHMFADTLAELHAMADHLGLRRKWFQGQKTPHYDICQTKRKLAMQAGAVVIERYQVVMLIHSWAAEKENHVQKS